MNFRKILGHFVAVGAIAAAAIVCLVALAFALFAGLKDVIGPALAYVSVAGAAGLVAIATALVITHEPKPKYTKKDDESLTGKAIQLVHERPLVAAGVGVIAAIVMVRNPKLLGTLAAILLAPKPPPRK